MLKRFLTLLVTMVFLLLNISAVASDFDLSTMTKTELEDLRNRINEEIKTNHTTTSSEEDKILELTKNCVESYLANHQAKSISWPWFDYNYSKDWNLFTLTTSVSYRTDEGKSEPNVYSEVYEKDGTYSLYYVKLGNVEIFNRRSEISDSRLNGNDEKKDSTVTVKTTRGSISFGASSAATTKPTITPTPEPKLFFGFNDPAEHDGMKYTMLSYRESKGSAFNKPDSGNVFLIVEFLIQNQGKSSAFVSYYDFNAYCDDYQTDISFSAIMETKTSLSGEIAPGKKMKGELAFEVPKNWRTFELHLSTGWFSDEIIFKGTKK